MEANRELAKEYKLEKNTNESLSKWVEWSMQS
jgi:hypothetical protein